MPPRALSSGQPAQCQRIRTLHGSKSVSLGNIIDAYDNAGGGGLTDEFAFDEVEKRRARPMGPSPERSTRPSTRSSATRRSWSWGGGPTPSRSTATLEEGRADLIALYFMLDEKLIELAWSRIETGRCEYDGYIRNVLMQLRRLGGRRHRGSHMRNRAWVSHWVVERAAADNSIREINQEGKTFYNIVDYDRVRELFGELLREVQRIKSQGDYEAAKALVEGYGVKVDPVVHQQVLDRAEALGIAPYGGFINPELVPTLDESGAIIDVELSYPADFTEQMLGYGDIRSPSRVNCVVVSRHGKPRRIGRSSWRWTMRRI